MLKRALGKRNARRLWLFTAEFLLGIAGLALITFVCFRLGIGLARTGFAYVILVALVSLCRRCAGESIYAWLKENRDA